MAIFVLDLCRHPLKRIAQNRIISATNLLRYSHLIIHSIAGSSSVYLLLICRWCWVSEQTERWRPATLIWCSLVDLHIHWALPLQDTIQIENFIAEIHKEGCSQNSIAVMRCEISIRTWNRFCIWFIVKSDQMRWSIGTSCLKVFSLQTTSSKICYSVPWSIDGNCSKSYLRTESPSRLFNIRFHLRWLDWTSHIWSCHK